MKKLFILTFSILIFTSCASFTLSQKPEASIEKFDIESISLRDITLLFDIGISNPYPIGMKLDDVIMKFSIEGRQLFKTNTGNGFRIKASRKSTTVLRVNLKYKDIMRIVRNYNQKDYLNCMVDVKIILPLPNIPGLEKFKSFDYQLKKQIPAIKPTIKIVNFKIRKPSMSDVNRAIGKSKKDLNSKKVYGMINDIISGKKPKKIIDPSKLDLKLGVDFDIVLKNNTKAKLEFKSLEYDFYVNSDSLINGKTNKIKNYGNKSILRVSNEFSTMSLSKSILNALYRKKGNYSLKGETSIKLPNSIKRSPVKLIFNEKGLLKIR